MLYANISTPVDSIRCKFPCEPLALYTYFEDMGIECPLSKVKLTDYETDATRIRISGDTEVDAHLAKLFSRKNTLYDVNTVATVIERMKKGFQYNDIISFEDREDSIVIRKEKVCDGCRNQPICKPTDSVTLLEFLDSLSAEEQRAALVHLSVAWAEKQEVKDSER